MKIMVFGGCGFIGSHVVGLLHRNKSNRIFVFDDLSTGKLENIRHLISEKHNTRITFNLLDICNAEHVEEAIGRFRPEVIVLLAAQASISISEKNPFFDARVNVIGILNVITSARKWNVGKIVFSSTSAVYKEKRFGRLSETDVCQPKSPYGISKLAAEQYLRTLFPSSVVLRFGNVYGPRQVPIGENQVIPRMIRHFNYGDDFKIFGDGNQTRDYVYVEDVAEAVECSVIGKTGTYNVASGKRLSVNRIASILCEIYKLPEKYPFEHRVEPDKRRDICLDVHLANDCLGWSAHTHIENGIGKTVEWWEKQG